MGLRDFIICLLNSRLSWGSKQRNPEEVMAPGAGGLLASRSGLCRMLGQTGTAVDLETTPPGSQGLAATRLAESHLTGRDPSPLQGCSRCSHRRIPQAAVWACFLVGSGIAASLCAEELRQCRDPLHPLRSSSLCSCHLIQEG